MVKFKSASIILPVLNETFSFIETVSAIESSCYEFDLEYIIVICNRTSPESIDVCRKIAPRNRRVAIHNQSVPFSGGAVREGFIRANGSHVVMMSSDLETNPADVVHLLRSAKEHPDEITTASRWIPNGGFVGYPAVKLALNCVFQKLIALLYGTRLSDLTYGYRIFPTELVKRIVWQEQKHPFFLETALKPLRLGMKFREIPTVWKARNEGTSANPFMANFAYFKCALRCRFMPVSQIAHPTP